MGNRGHYPIEMLIIWGQPTDLTVNLHPSFNSSSVKNHVAVGT